MRQRRWLRATETGQPLAVGHDHEQRAAVDECELLPKEASVVLGLVPEFGDRTQVIRGRDHCDAYVVAIAPGRGREPGELRLLGGGNARVLGQEQRLRREYVAGGVAIGAREGGTPPDGKRDDGDQHNRAAKQA